MEFFFTVNGKVNYFSPDKGIWKEYIFDDDNQKIREFDVITEVDYTKALDAYEPTALYHFTPEDYPQVKFLFLQYLTRNGASLNATEVYEDRERINRQSLQTLEMSKIMSDQNLEKQALQLEFNKLELDDMKKQLRRAQMGLGTDNPSKILN